MGEGKQDKGKQCNNPNGACDHEKAKPLACLSPLPIKHESEVSSIGLHMISSKKYSFSHFLLKEFPAQSPVILLLN